MPYGMCPLCGQTSHFSVGDVKEWYEQYHPGIPFGSLVPATCFCCFQDLRLGDSVVIRNVFVERQRDQIGEIGVITDILAAKDGLLFLVRLSSGEEIYFVRAQLRKQRENEGNQTRSPTEETSAVGQKEEHAG
jgi:hypothetical protein